MSPFLETDSHDFNYAGLNLPAFYKQIFEYIKLIHAYAFLLKSSN
jgi:hypothetical protein